MITLTILTGLSCTLKDSIANVLEKDYNYIKFPDVNREYINCLMDVAVEPSMVNVTGKIPNIMLVSNRLNIYRTFLNTVLKVSSDTNINFVMQRTILEHLFFPNEELLVMVDKQKLISAEREFLSRFDKVKLVLVENNNVEMLNKFYLTDDIRTSITKTDDKLEAYFRMQGPYKRFVSQLKEIDEEYQLVDEVNITSEKLTNITNNLVDSIRW